MTSQWRRALAFGAGCFALLGHSIEIRASDTQDDCAPEPRGEARIVAVIDGRTLRLDDGRIVRLAGLAPLPAPRSAAAASTLVEIVAGRTLSLHSDDDSPDRYGRQQVWAFATGEQQSLQATLIAKGAGLREPGLTDKACRRTLEQAERVARDRRMGLWAAPTIAKNPETPDDISAEIGHFTVVEGRVRSVRQTGGTSYLNFGRRGSEGFAVVVPARAVPAFEAAGLPLKGLEGRRLQVRGYVMRRSGPQIEVLGPEQIDVVGGGAVATTGTRD